MTKKLTELLSTLPKEKNIKIQDVFIKGVSDDSRKIKNGYLFVAVKGLTHDGHDFIGEAVKNGAKAVVGEKSVDAKGFVYIKVKDSRDALGEIASNWFGNPSKKLKIIGITGTKGKTTTAYLVFHLLSKYGKKAGLVSSIKAKIGENEVDTGFHITSPDVLSLHKFLKEMVDAGCEYAVLEVSSHGIVQKRMAGIEFEVGVLTNIAPEHLDYHKTLKEYKKTKMSFIGSAKKKVVSRKNTKINILPGKYNNLNAQLAVDTVKIFGIDEKKAVDALQSFELPEGRMEEIKNDRGFRFFVDFAHTPDSLKAALKYLSGITKGRLISVFGAAGERDRQKRPKMGKAAADYSDIIILTAEDPRSEKVEDIMAQIKSGMPKFPGSVFEIRDRGKAIEKALKSARIGDTVVLLGKGHEKSMNLDGIHEVPWSDQKIVRKYMRRLFK